MAGAAATPEIRHEYEAELPVQAAGCPTDFYGETPEPCGGTCQRVDNSLTYQRWLPPISRTSMVRNEEGVHVTDRFILAGQLLAVSVGSVCLFVGLFGPLNLARAFIFASAASCVPLGVVYAVALVRRELNHPRN